MSRSPTTATSAGRVVGVAANARAIFEPMEGLRFKFFTYSEKEQRATNFYVWESRRGAREVLLTRLRERITGLYAVAPTIEFVEIAPIVDNSDS